MSRIAHIRPMVAVLALLMGSSMLFASAPAAADPVSSTVRPAADLTLFTPGNIISDAVFFNSNAMNEAQIQAFLESKVPVCQAGYTCLKDWYDTSRSVAADAMCGPYQGAVGERASRIIFKVAQACGINPQVILVTLQKEQGLTTHVWPSEWRYDAAMGQGCPDTAPCDPDQVGFFNQVYGAAWQWKRYANPLGTATIFTWYAPGKTWNIRYSPEASCGSSPVLIANQATANLYYYTPYQPNAAALAAGYGASPDKVCSTYGNRNFYNYFTDWFGSTQSSVGLCAQPDSSVVAAAWGEVTVSVASLNARSAPTTSCEPVLRSLSQGTILTRTGVHGEWTRVRLDGATFWVSSAYLTPTPGTTYASDRAAGADRFATASAIAAETKPRIAGTVYLASGSDFPDALAGAPLVVRNAGALLLTSPSSLPAETASRLQSLAPTRVVVLGGPVSVADSVITEVTRLLGPSVAVERIAGADRYDTARAIAAAGWTTTSSVYLATGAGFADALGAAGLAAARDMPVILVDGRAATIPPETIALLQRLSVRTTIVAGGEQAISASITTQLEGLGITVSRIAGADRVETSRLLNLAVYPMGAPRVLLATATDFPDALAGAVLAGTQKLPLFTQPPSCMTGRVKDYVVSPGVARVTLLGGPFALSDAVLAGERC